MNTNEGMKATLPNGKRVHQMRNGAPRCGGGRHGRRGPWQMDLGDVTCRRCLTLAAWDWSREAREGGNGRGHEQAKRITAEPNHQ